MAEKTRTIVITSTADESEKIELAVNPKNLSIQEDGNDKTVSLINQGTVLVAGKRGLIKTTISTFLPSDASPYYKGVLPETITGYIRKWKQESTPVRVIVTGTDINTLFLITSRTESYVEGQKDINITLSLSEYRELKVVTVESIKEQTGAAELSDREDTKKKPETVVVHSGDTLWAFAVKFYNDGTQWTKIQAANNNVDPRKLQIGQELIIP